MLEYPKRPEGTLEEQMAQVFDTLWRITEQVNLLLEELAHDQDHD